MFKNNYVVFFLSLRVYKDTIRLLTYFVVNLS